MICILTLYEIPYLKEENNFAFTKIGGIVPQDDKNIFPFLNAYAVSTKSISDFQFQRPELNKKIKVNISQINCLDFASAKKYTYIQVSYPKPNQVLGSIHYLYYIVGYKQIAQSTIEYELKMDVLNTFVYVSNANNKFEYSLSDRTLINRQHKDRIAKLNEVKITIRNYGEIGTQTLDYYYIDLETYIQDHPDETISYEFMNSSGFSPDDPKTSDFVCDVLDLSGNVLHSFGLATTYGLGIQFYYDSVAITTRIIYVFMIKMGGVWQQMVSPYTYSGTPDELRLKLHFKKIPIEYIVNKTYIDQLKAFITDNEMYFIVGKYYKVIDRYPEGIDCVLYHDEKQDKLLLDDDGLNTWYVAYSSANAVVQSPTDTESKYVNPVHVAFYSDNGYSLSLLSPREVIYRATEVPKITDREEWIIIDLQDLEVGGYVEIGGVQFTSAGHVIDGTTYYQILLMKKNNNDTSFRRVAFTNGGAFPGVLYAENVPEVIFYGLNYCELWTAVNDGRWSEYQYDITIGSGTQATTYSSDGIRDVDLTEPKLIKIINFPYAPREDLIDMEVVPSGMAWSSDSGAFELTKAQNANFERTIYFAGNPTNLRFNWTGIPVGYNNLYRMPRLTLPESKMSNSAFSYAKFVYDSFSFAFRKEEIDLDTYVRENYDGESLWVNYYCSPNMNSKFMFQFVQYVCDRASQDYNNVLIVERNNEIALYTNAYINYIRSGGFAHDSKNADVQKLTNGLTLALSTIGAVGSFASSAVTGGAGIVAGIGLTIGTAAKTINAIVSAQQADRNISQKLLTASQQGTSVFTSEDISILKAYSNNKAKLCYYNCSEYMSNALNDLFYYFGYRCHDYGVPDINTRCNFNFVSADIVFKDHSLPEEIADEIRKKWSQGITFFHPQLINSSYSWDIFQEYENTENTFIGWENE